MHVPIAKIKHKPAATEKFLFEKPLNSAGIYSEFMVVGPVASQGAVTNQGAGRFMVQGRFAAQVQLVCSRCLKDFFMPVSGDIQALYSTEPLIDESGEVEAELFTGDIIDISGLLLNEIAFLLPMQPICADDCRGLCPGCGIDLNIADCNCAEQQIDPRWEKLKSLQRHSEE